LKITDKFVFFWGYADPYSNFYTNDASFLVGGINFNCSEQFFMYHKAMMFEEYELAAKIIASRSPKDQKAFGRCVKIDYRIWDAQKYDIMVEGVYMKFKQNKVLKNLMLSHINHQLVEASPIDPIWGIGMGVDNVDVENPVLWKGANLLGQALMDARERISKEEQQHGI
jgi:ribA/ribD-fused uncharacterized protein